MKLKDAIAIGALGCISFGAVAQQPQQQSPWGPPALTTQAAVGGPILLNLTGVTVTDASGQPIGPIQNLLLSPTGCADLAVVSLGGQKLVPVPWELISGSGSSRGETDVTTRAAFALKVDRAVLMQAPSLTLAQLSQLTQPQVVQQVHVFYAQQQPQQQQQQGTAAGAPGSQTAVNVGAGGSVTNRPGVTNANVNTNLINQTNQTGILSPTGATNVPPGRPAFETNRPGQPTIIPPGRAPATRPPTNTPPPAVPPGALPNQPGQF